MARDQRLFRDSVEPAWVAARQFLPLAEEGDFKFRFRLLRLCDQVDSYLTLLRSTAWWERQVTVDGDWPTDSGPRLMLTSHWGAGGWIWKLLRRRGIDAHFVARRAEYRDLGLGRIALWYAYFREWAIRRIGCAGPIYLGGSTPILRQTFAARDSVVGMLDLPSPPGRAAFERNCLGKRMRFPRGLIDLAVAENVPVVLLSFGLDPMNGRRHLHIEALPPGLDAEQIASLYVQHFARRLVEQPAYWQLWIVAPALFQSAAHGE